MNNATQLAGKFHEARKLLARRCGDLLESPNDPTLRRLRDEAYSAYQKAESKMEKAFETTR